MIYKQLPKHISLSHSVEAILASAKSVCIVDTMDDLVELSVPENKTDAKGFYDVAYDVGGKEVVEARVCRVRNGISANYLEAYMRRRDPDCMFIADEHETDKPTFQGRFGYDFNELREETLAWLKTQDIVCFFFEGGVAGMGIPGVVVAPANAGFFALGLAMLQGICPLESIKEDYYHEAVIYVAPPFRHTHFSGKQVVVHNRRDSLYELYSYNLYPGPSAKKGVYGMLLDLGEKENWATAHCSTVQVVTPYDNITTIMHEGASGGGKSEMLEHIHREEDGRLTLGKNVITGEKVLLALPRGCRLWPVTDDMALCHPDLQSVGPRGEKKLTVVDAETAWFLRVNHINHYGIDPHLERLTMKPQSPLLFLNIDAVPGSTALIWEHIEDAPGKPCPNPRVVINREQFPDIVSKPVRVDIRSFGVRCPPCTRQNPSYGIFGLFHIISPSLAWLWRLVSPRGHGNPSIISEEGLQSEGVGSYWPFATGKKDIQANILFEQIQNTQDTLFALVPNQHVGAWKVGFAPQWVTREYLARRGTAPFAPEALELARCPLLGRVPKSLLVENQEIPPSFIKVHLQPEVGEDGYDAGAAELTRFFHETLREYLTPDLEPAARRIIQACLDGATAEQLDGMM